jgi:hypothetical protein
MVNMIGPTSTYWVGSKYIVLYTYQEEELRVVDMTIKYEEYQKKNGDSVNNIVTTTMVFTR